MTHALAALFLFAAPAGAAPAGTPELAAPPVRAGGAAEERPAVRLTSPEEVAQLCAALRPAERLRPEGDAVERGAAETRHALDRDAALAARYEAIVPAAGLAFAPYDGPERRLALAEPAQVAIAGGSARVWPTEERGLAVEADAAAARRILEAQRNGTLSLALSFDLPDDAACASGARGTALAVPAEPVSWRWLDGETVLARGGAGSDRPLLSLAQGALPRVDVGEPIAGPVEAKKAVLAKAPDLEACYAEALKRDPSIDGVLVADIGGRQPAISADSVGDTELAACVQRALVPLARARGGKVAVPIRFELQPPGAAKDTKQAR